MAADVREGAVTRQQRPGEVSPGSVVVIDDVAFAVVGEPFLGIRGTGVFDQPELFWRARARPLHDAHDAGTYVTWSPDETVTVYEASSPERDAHRT